ncbi:MAG: PAS domain-containing sensor histidine kinase [Bacteroidota bacterium]
MERNRSEKHDSEEMRRLEAIFQHSQDGIITIDQRGAIESINPAAAHLFGYTPEEVVGQNVKMLMPEPYHSEHDGYIGNYHQTGVKRIIGIGREVQGRRNDGSTFPFFLSVSEVQLDGRIIYTGFIHDVSEIRRKEKELEESRNRLKAIFDTVIDGIIIIDAKGLIRMVNPAVSKLFDYTAEEMEGQNVTIIMPEPHRSGHDAYMERYQSTRKPHIIGIGREVEGRRKDGSLFPLNLSVSEVVLNDGIIYTGIIHDLSSQKAVEKEIRELNQLLEKKVDDRTAELSATVNKLLAAKQELESEIKGRQEVERALRQSEKELKQALEAEKELSELKSRFVSMASHEFRTPLSTILSSAAIIGRYTQEEQQPNREKHIQRIKSAVNNLTGILNDFLSLSKLEEGKVANNPVWFSIDDLCKEVIDEIQGLLKKDQELEHKSAVADPMIHLDKRLLKNVLFNLLSNAIKYSKEGQTIHCLIKSETEKLVLSIRDEGIGIPVKDQVHLFGRFFRATNVTNIQGTGLGLNIVKNYVELMGGQIDFISAEGQGSTFTITFPL